MEGLLRINDAMNGGMGMVREGCRCREESGGRCGWGGGARTEVGDFFSIPTYVFKIIE